MFRTWVKKCFDNVVDPDKDAEIEELTQLLHQGLIQRKQAFVLNDVVKDRPHKITHRDQAAVNLYRMFLERAWRDGKVEPRERDDLAWISKCLEIPKSQANSLNERYARARFAEVFAQAMDDGEITQEESLELEGIAKAAGASLKQFVRLFFLSEGEAFLRGVFAAMIESNTNPHSALEKLVATAGCLGLTRVEAQETIRYEAARMIEHVLADAKEDNLLSVEEERQLDQLLRTFELPADTRAYVVKEIAALKLLTNVSNGRLPSLQAPQDLSLRAGELVHYYGGASWETVKLLKNGPSRTWHEGKLTITDARLVFNSPTRSEAIGYRKVVGYQYSRSGIEIQVGGKPANRIVCDGDVRIVGAILKSAIAMTNQTLINQDESRRSRHISREVRQRVWQRYSGQCADCNATSYLEFDHIIPVAKGGSNEDANVQLLCRNCNSKKSDMI